MTENTSKNSPKQEPFHINSNHSFTMRMGEGAYTLGVQLVLPENKTMKSPIHIRIQDFEFFAIFPVHILCHHGRGEGGGVLQIMMVDDLGGDGGPKKAIL